MKNFTKILAAAAIGVVAGGVLGLLFAPDKGTETRKKISGEKDKMLKKIKGRFNKEKVARMKEKLEKKLQQLNAKMEEFSKEESGHA